jgi:hypothetical protein
MKPEIAINIAMINKDGEVKTMDIIVDPDFARMFSGGPEAYVGLEVEMQMKMAGFFKESSNE